MKARSLAVLLALPLVALGCGGGSDRSPSGCTLRVRGAVSEDLWCVVAAYDYSAMPGAPMNVWGFELVAYRGSAQAMEVGAGVGVFLGGRPALDASHGWDGATRSALLTDGSAERLGANALPTHRAWSIDETGSLSVEFSAIPPASATNAELMGVHGTLTGTLQSSSGGDPVTFSASF
jgi:hypothetical protein